MLRLNSKFGSLRRYSSQVLNTIAYTRHGEQPLTAQKSLKTISKTDTGITIATLDSHGPAASVAVYIAAGSRNESTHSFGSAHLFKRSLVRNIKDDSIVRTVMETDLRGNSLFSSVGREHIILGSEFLRDDVVDVVPSLLNNVFNTAFEVYEFIDAVDGAGAQSASALSDSHVQVVEKIHQIAFRRGLGNSVFATHENLDELDRASLRTFASNYLSPDRIAVVATGVAHKDLKKLVEESMKNVTLPLTSTADSITKYYGGEARIDGGSHSESLYAIAYPGTAFTSKEYYASLVIREIFGSSSHIKHGSPSKIETESTSVTGFSTSYSDTGLIGFIAKGPASEMKGVVSAALAHLKTPITVQAFESAKKSALIVGEADLNRQGSITALGQEATTNTAFLTDLSGIETVTIAQILKATLAAKPSIVAYGDLYTLPYADEL